MKFIVKEIEIGYEKPLLNRPVNIEINSGKLIALIGKNGSGKSTLLKTLSGILKPLKGQLYIDEILLNNPKIFSQNISIVLNEKPLHSLGVDEVLSMGRIPYTNILQTLKTNDLEIINNIVNTLNISHLLNKKINQISDGERQIIMIARALIQDTPVLLLDEPTTHLDLENKARLLKLLKEISKNKIVIFSTHDINLISNLVDNFWIIKNNKFIAIEDKKELKKELSHLFMSKNLIFDEKEDVFRIV